MNMADYQQMYLALFRKVTNIIELLQEAQIEAEEFFLTSEETELQILPPVLEAADCEQK